MASKKEDDKGLEALRKAHKKNDQSVPFDLVAQFYNVEKSHQFDDDDSAAQQKLREVLNEHVEKVIAK